MGVLTAIKSCIILALALSAVVRCTPEVEDAVATLKHLRDAAKHGVISFSQADFEHFGLGAKRDYTLVGFLYAKNLLENTQLQLGKVMAEFGLASKAFSQGKDAGKIFFYSMDFEENQQLFKRLGVNQAPFIFTWQPKMGPRPSGMIDIASDNQMVPSKTPGYPWKAEDFIGFTSKQTGLTAGEIVRPTLLNDPLFPVYAFGFLLLMAATAYRAYHSPVIRMPIFWLLGSLVVYWFATSGGLFNIIRGMPMYFINKERKLQFFLPGRQGQLGVEGFIMGGSYLVFSLLLAAFTYGAPLIKDTGLRGGASLTFVVTAVYVFWKIFDTFTFKNGGYWIRQFFF